MRFGAVVDADWLGHEPDDLLEDLKGLRTTPTTTELFAAPAPVVPPPVLEPAHQRVWDVLAEPKHGDEITRALGMSSAEVMGLLFTMEMKKLIRRGTGGVYERR